MPSRDSTGKRLSGAQLRQRKAEREQPDKPAAKKRRAKQIEIEQAPADGWFAGPNPFERAGPPPIDDTAQMIRWGAKIHALGVEDIYRHPNSYPSRREWIRALLDKTTQLGVIRDKAAEQQKIDDALHRDDVKGKKQGLTDVRGRKAPTVTRPTG